MGKIPKRSISACSFWGCKPLCRDMLPLNKILNHPGWLREIPSDLLCPCSKMLSAYSMCQIWTHTHQCNWYPPFVGYLSSLHVLLAHWTLQFLVKSILIFRWLASTCQILMYVNTCCFWFLLFVMDLTHFFSRWWSRFWLMIVTFHWLFTFWVWCMTSFSVCHVPIGGCRAYHRSYILIPPCLPSDIPQSVCHFSLHTVIFHWLSIPSWLLVNQNSHILYLFLHHGYCMDT